MAMSRTDDVDVEARRPSVRRTVIALVAVAVLIYLAFIAAGVFGDRDAQANASPTVPATSPATMPRAQQGIES
jgi:hypothetical protein